MFRTRVLVVLAGPAAAVALVGGPGWAGATEMFDVGDVARVVAGTYSVVPACAAPTGVSSGLGQITYVVHGSADATATNGAVAVGTTVTCKIVEIDDYVAPRTVYGTVAGGLPGPHAEAAGTVTMSTVNTNPGMCAFAHAVFSDGGLATFRSAKSYCANVSP